MLAEVGCLHPRYQISLFGSCKYFGKAPIGYQASLLFNGMANKANPGISFGVCSSGFI